MEFISVFDMLKIGVGPSSSHTLGPWRAAEQWIEELQKNNLFDNIVSVTIDLYGSLSLTGKGHATDLAILLGLSGTDPEYIPVDDIQSIIDKIKNTNTLNFGGKQRFKLFNRSDYIQSRIFTFSSKWISIYMVS